MNDRLTVDEYDALEQMSRPAKKGSKPTACVARNAKKLTGQKYAAYRRDGQLELTEKGRQTLLIKRCIDALRALAADPLSPVKPEIAVFLLRKGHLAEKPEGGFEVTDKGRESLADIDATMPGKSE